MSKNWQQGTKAVQAGYDPASGEARVAPMVQSTTYRYDSSDHVAALFDLEAVGHIYSRISNPTVGFLEEKICALEGGVGALATASGQAAVTYALLNLCRSGQHIVASSALYGGTHTLLSSTFKRFGIEVTLVDPDADIDILRQAFRPETRALYGETIGNPGLGVLDFAKFAQVAREKHVPLIVDNTFASPCLCRPLEHGANLVVHSTSKFLDGHARALGGVIVDGGNFDYALDDRYPEFTQPDPNYHGVIYTKTFGTAAFIVKARVTLLRDLGATMSPFNAFLTMQGSETLHLRMAQHSSNALALARHLEEHPQVTWVNYPGLPGSREYVKASRYLPKGASGIITFGVKGGAAAGKKFIDSLRLAALVVHVADVRTSALHPASTTHRQLDVAAQLAAGVAPDLIRFSVGIEDIEDIIADVDQALAAL
jgi:O-acetylhomoserine (thiol)-lyase